MEMWYVSEIGVMDKNGNLITCSCRTGPRYMIIENDQSKFLCHECYKKSPYYKTFIEIKGKMF